MTAKPRHSTAMPDNSGIKSADLKKTLSLIREQGVEFVDLRFTDPRGNWHHLTQTAATITEQSLREGFFIDGSSLAGWRSIDNSDVLLRPDPSTAVMDSFSARPQLILICDVLEPQHMLTICHPDQKTAYSRDPRRTARAAVDYMQKSGIGDEAFFGPEAEFFIFDSARFGVGENYSTYRLDSVEGPDARLREYAEGNMGHRPELKGGYTPVAPVDSESDLRAEMLSMLSEMGVSTEKHHHEVARSQHELGMKFAPLLQAADQMQIYKYCVRNVAHSYGKTATFMPKPILGDNGSGMHVHQSIWKDGKTIFAGNKYGGLSEAALHYIGGILKHARALNAFTNASTNSYKRLVPGFEAPVLLAYSAANRSASCRIPLGFGESSRRVEVRFPDCTANPYLAFSAMLMAGLDGIKNRIDPGRAVDQNLYQLPQDALKKIPTVARSLREALDALEEDHAFLLEGGVFTEEQIQAYADLKRQDVLRLEQTPHPVEFEMYYSA